ncbi:hypothetical protein FWF48_00400 [Candidatus Saccharibacteria bacterium]|nr:hypothetical protein [Candidatus Saccharibacteria bacterium]
MVTNHKVKIIAFVGLTGAGKSSATDYLASKGMPRVVFDSFKSTQDNLQNLIDAGQSHIVINSIPTFGDYRALKHAFPGMLTVIALTPNKTVRYKRIKRLLGSIGPLQTHEHFGVGAVMVNADYTIDSSGTTQQLQQKIDDILDQIGVEL